MTSTYFTSVWDTFKYADLLAVGISIAAMGLLGSIILLNDRASITNRTFFTLTLSAILWSAVNYVSYQTNHYVDLTLWMLRFVLFFAVWFAFYLFKFTYVFQERLPVFPSWYRFGLVPIVALTSLFTLTPFIFPRIAEVSSIGAVSKTQVLPGIYVFGAVVFFLIIGSFYLLIRKTIAATPIDRVKYFWVLIGTIITFSLIFAFDFILAGLFLNVSYIPLSGLYIFPFVALTSYAIYKHRLFNLKVATTAFLGFMVTVFTFVNVLYSTSAGEVVLNATAFLVVLFGSIKIIQDTLSLKRLTEELSETNERQETLIHFIGHEVKGFLTKDAGAFAAIADGDFGMPPDGMKPFAEQALAESRQGADSVANILKASNLKKGTVTYEKEPFDFKELALEAVEHARKQAEQKSLALTFRADGDSFQMTGDKAQLNDHVLRNLIDNAINYTLSGSIDVSLSKEGNKITFAVKDTGVGIDAEDKKRLFTEGGHGKESQHVNAHSTGYGLYIAKKIVEAHGGAIRAESAGPGKGSTFIVEFPAI